MMLGAHFGRRAHFRLLFPLLAYKRCPLCYAAQACVGGQGKGMELKDGSYDTYNSGLVVSCTVLLIHKLDG